MALDMSSADESIATHRLSLEFPALGRSAMLSVREWAGLNHSTRLAHFLAGVVFGLLAFDLAAFLALLSLRIDFLGVGASLGLFLEVLFFLVLAAHGRFCLATGLAVLGDVVLNLLSGVMVSFVTLHDACS